MLLSISTTTRAPRAGEVDGRDYYFVSGAEFQQRLAAGRFIEHADFGGERYGTELTNIERAQKESKDLLLDIEVQGVRQLKQLFPGRVVTTFVFPPSFTELEARLRARASENEEQIAVRLKTARGEVAILKDPLFSDFIVVNDQLEAALALSKSIVAASRALLSRQSPEEISKLLK